MILLIVIIIIFRIRFFYTNNNYNIIIFNRNYAMERYIILIFELILIPEAALLMANRRWLLGRLTTTRRGMICPVDVADRDRMMSARILRGHGGSDVSTPCRSDRPGGSVTTDRFKVVRKGYTLVGARPEPQQLIAKALERANAVRDRFAVLRTPRQCLWLPTSPAGFHNALWFFRANRCVESVRWKYSITLQPGVAEDRAKLLQYR